MHETVARARKNRNRKKLRISAYFWKMRSAKGARDCSQTLISHNNSKKTQSLGALVEDEAGKFH